MKDECKIKYSCGCVVKHDFVNKTTHTEFLCKIHYKQVVNFNATHKLVKAYLKKCKPRWQLIK